MCIIYGITHRFHHRLNVNIETLFALSSCRKGENYEGRCTYFELIILIHGKRRGKEWDVVLSTVLSRLTIWTFICRYTRVGLKRRKGVPSLEGCLPTVTTKRSLSGKRSVITSNGERLEDTVPSIKTGYYPKLNPSDRPRVWIPCRTLGLK